MKPEETERLRYRRQYLLLPEITECPFQHNTLELAENLYLYSHIDLKVTYCKKDKYTLVCLGDLFDFEFPEKDNAAILEDLFDKDFNKALKKSFRYCGRYVLIYLGPDEFKIFHDTIASRKIYYYQKNNRLWIGSQPHLLTRILNLMPTKDAAKLLYYKSEDFLRLFNANVSHTTFYDELSQVMPNHYLDVITCVSTRYWPNEPVVKNPKDETAELAAKMITGYLDAIQRRYNPMLPVTAGKDSRTLLAASQSFAKNVYFYLNHDSGLEDDCADLQIPAKLLSDLNLDFHVLNPYIKIEKTFEKIYFENNPFGSRAFLPFIYNYYTNFPDKVNLPGNSPVAGKEYYFKFRKKIPGLEDLLELDELKKYEFVRKEYKKWLSTSKDLCIQNNIPILTLFYWEQRLTNGILQVQLDKDIAQEEFNPFNSRDLALTFLSAGPGNLLPPHFRFYKKIMKILWPEVLHKPINPSKRTNVLKLLSYMGLLDVSYRLKHYFE